MRRTLSVLTIALVVIAAGTIAGSAASPKTPPSKQDIAKRILATPAGKALTPTARIALEAIARGDHKATPDSNGITAPATVRQPKGAKPGGGPLPNVRVNDPAKDSNQIDQTTQSETSIAVSGSNVAVGYNDSQPSAARQRARLQRRQGCDGRRRGGKPLRRLGRLHHHV